MFGTSCLGLEATHMISSQQIKFNLPNLQHVFFANKYKHSIWLIGVIHQSIDHTTNPLILPNWLFQAYRSIRNPIPINCKNILFSFELKTLFISVVHQSIDELFMTEVENIVHSSRLMLFM